tara:strand:- start:1129 stop:1302 length:174 start_codon:yes stop_codon:yes gene_type:complete
MCFFGGGQQAAPPPPVSTAPPATPGAAVEEDYADSLSEKQKRLRAGQDGDNSSSLLT